MNLLSILSDPRVPVYLAIIVALARLAYAAASRLVQPYPRVRALVEALAALAPDVLRAALQVVAAVTGRPAAKLDVVPGPDLAGALAIEERNHASARATIGELLGRTNDLSAERDALARRVAELTAGEGDTVRPTVVPGEPRPQATTTRHRVVRPPEVEASPDESTAGHPDGVRGAL